MLKDLILDYYYSNMFISTITVWRRRHCYQKPNSDANR
jgi:hypothetical protein